jgi:hypothetical protein
MNNFALAVGAAALLAATSAQADAINNLTISTLTNPVPQSQSSPCVICATMVQQPVGFGFNNFDSQGNDSAFNLFSSAVTGAFANDDDVNVTPYTSGFLRSFLLSKLDVALTFGIVIDINTAHGGETLVTFQLIDLDKPIGSKVIFDIDGPIALPDIRNGNGKGDYLFTGFDLSSIDIGDRLLFRAKWTGASDGGEVSISWRSLANRGTEPGALALMGLGLLGLGWLRRRKS